MSTAMMPPEVRREAPAPQQLPPSMVERMTLILDAFDSSTTRLTLEQVARATGLPRSTAHRILDQLLRLQWLSHSSLGYGLGDRALGLGGASGSQQALRGAAAPTLHELQVRTGLVVHLAVLEGGDVFYLDKVGGRFAAAVPSRVGGRAPTHCTALGKAMLAWLPPEEVERLVADRLGAGPERRTARTIPDVATLHQELHRIRGRHGLAFEQGECFPEIACVAVAVRGPDRPIAAISLVGEVSAPLERVAPLVVDAARRVAEQLYPGLDRAGRCRRGRQEPAADDACGWSTQALDRMLAVGQNGDWL
ncbi:MULTISPECIES: IclR family transcriptional regulator [unclassified Nocardioides]|uniref:IclR family transcriptional regulator n=1 Tax=unclassified Nocardioides TaxID=2615069 RepID=UPI0036061E2C